MAEDRTVDTDVAPGVELAEKGPDFERRVGEPVARRRAPAPVVVQEDTHVEREDLGPDTVTFVAKGDAVPVALAGLPRRPAQAREHKRG